MIQRRVGIVFCCRLWKQRNHSLDLGRKHLCSVMVVFSAKLLLLEPPRRAPRESGVDSIGAWLKIMDPLQAQAPSQSLTPGLEL